MRLIDSRTSASASKQSQRRFSELSLRLSPLNMLRDRSKDHSATATIADASPRHLRRWEIALVGIIIAFGCARIANTYRQLSQTFDEPAHVACGLELLQYRTYRYETQHPPLARIMAALPLFLTGVHGEHQPDMWQEGNSILNSEHHYSRNLELARMGTLPFFIFACLGIYLLARQISTGPTSIVAVALFSLLPSIIGHAGLATTDMAATAGVVGSLAGWCYWLREPSLRRSLLLGLIVGLSFLTKFSVIPFVGLSALLAFFTIALTNREFVRTLFTARASGLLILALITSLATMWAGYGLSLHPVTSVSNRPHQLVSHILSSHPSLYEMANEIVEAPIPLSEVVQGVTYLGYHLKNGHASFLLGKVSNRGSWLFFPIAIAIKTPLPFLCLVLIGTVIGVATNQTEVDGLQTVPLVAAFAILLVCVPSSINIGIRHILPLFAFLSIVAAQGAMWLFARRGRAALVSATTGLILSAWLLTSSFRAGPEYIAYFNELASQAPENILVESDLDWGQDIDLLSRWCRDNRVPHLWIAYFGSAELSHHDLPSFEDLPPFEPRTGFIAVSLTRKQMGFDGKGEIPLTGPGGYRWLDSHKPIANIGKSIRVYEIRATN